MNNPGTIWEGLYSVKVVRQFPSHIFVFGDNIVGWGKGGQACIRDEQNAFGIPTKLYPSMDARSFFSDEIETARDFVFDSIDRLVNVCIITNGIATFPAAGLGTGRAELPTRAPKLYADMCDYIYEQFSVNLFHPELIT